jgi:HK97 family phage portal protein
MSLRSLLGGIVRNQAPVPYTSKWQASRIGLTFGSGGMDRHREIATYEAVGTLFGVVSKLAATTSLVDWKLWKPAASGLEEDRTEVTNHAAAMVWGRPNQFFGRQEFVESSQQHLDLAGESYWVVVRFHGVPVELWPIRPDRIEPVPSVKDFISGYIYRSPDGDDIPLRRQDVIFLRWPSPLDIYHGTSPLPALAGDISNERSQTAWSNSFYENSAQPGGVIRVDRRLQDEEFDELAERWDKMHRGVNNAGRVAILEEADYVPIVYTQRDMQYVETRGFTKQAILDAYGFPKFGLGDVDDVNRASADASLALIAQSLTVPRLERMKSALNMDFLPMFGVSQGMLEFDYESPVPPDIETENNTLTAKTNALQTLVSAGFDADEAADAVGLPRMKFEKPEPKIVQAPPGAAPGKKEDKKVPA